MCADFGGGEAVVVRLAGGAPLQTALTVADPLAWLALDTGVRTVDWYRPSRLPLWEHTALLPAGAASFDEPRLALALCHRDGRIRERAVHQAAGHRLFSDYAYRRAPVGGRSRPLMPGRPSGTSASSPAAATGRLRSFGGARGAWSSGRCQSSWDSCSAARCRRPQRNCRRAGPSGGLVTRPGMARRAPDWVGLLGRTAVGVDPQPRFLEAVLWLHPRSPGRCMGRAWSGAGFLAL